MKTSEQRILALTDLAEVLAKHNLVFSHDREVVRLEEPEGGNTLLIELRKITAIACIRYAANEVRNAAKAEG